MVLVFVLTLPTVTVFTPFLKLFFRQYLILYPFATEVTFQVSRAFYPFFAFAFSPRAERAIAVFTFFA